MLRIPLHPLRAVLTCGTVAAVLIGVAAVAAGQTTSSPDPSSAPAPAIDFKMEEHPTIRVGSSLEVRLRARLETSFRSWSLEPDVTDTDAAWRRRRVQVEGELFKKLEFEYSHEFGDTSEPERDAFVNLRLRRSFEVEAGRFKMPFGRDVQISGANLDLIHRSALGRQVAPGRDVGVMVHGRSRGRLLAYQAGYFIGDGDNDRTSKTQGGEHAVAGRAVVSPFARTKVKWAEPFRFGAAVVRSDLDQRLGLRGTSVFGDGIVFDRVFVNGTRWRLGLESEWERGPVSIAAEYASLRDGRAGMGLDGEALPDLTSRAWYVSGAWVVTGEEKRGRIEPRRGILKGGLGAVEVAARVERLALSPGTAAAGVPGAEFLFLPSANADRIVTFGASWFLHSRVKVQGNLVIEDFDDPSRSPVPRRNGRLTSVFLNLQFVL
jgi:phosphate-selective porin OprO/OprP